MNKIYDSQALSMQIDWQHLHQIADGSVEFEMELLQLFVEDSRQRLAILKEAVALQDWSLIEQSAHHLKGSSANIGALNIRAAASRLEQQARKKQLIAADNLISELDTSLNQIDRLVQLNVSQNGQEPSA